MTPPIPAIRASDAEREQHVELLREHAAQGRLSVEELSDRLDRAYAAQTRGELAVIVADLPAPDPPRTTSPRQGRNRGPELFVFLAVNALLVVIWATTGAGYFWPIWPILGWGLGFVVPCSRAPFRAYPTPFHRRPT